MKVKAGDVLLCPCEDCEFELTVTKTCADEVCSHESECEIEVTCCGQPMALKQD